MFTRASLKQHSSNDGVDVPRQKRQAKASTTIGFHPSRRLKDDDPVEFYGVLTVERGDGGNPVYVTVDSTVISVKSNDIEVALTPDTKHSAMVKIGEVTVLISDSEIISIQENNAYRVSKNDDGDFSLEPIGSVSENGHSNSEPVSEI